MNQFGISEKSFHLLNQALIRFPQIEETVIFGSRAKGNYKTGSDIDIAIKGKNCSPKIAWDLNAYLNEELPIPYFVPKNVNTRSANSKMPMDK